MTKRERMGFSDPDTQMDDLTDAGSDVMRETGVRYAAYASRFGFLVKKAGLVGMKKIAIKKATVKAAASKVSKVRHLAYSSDLGEAFRPVVPTWAVNATYGVAVSYVVADTAYRVYDAEEKARGSLGRHSRHSQTLTPHLLKVTSSVSIDPAPQMLSLVLTVPVWCTMLERMNEYE